MPRLVRLASLYFGLVIVLTVPIWGLGMMIDYQLLPGVPIGALAIVCPTLAAVIIGYGHGGRTKMLGILARGLDFRKAGWRLLLVALINPALFGVVFLTSRLFGANIPNPEFTAMHALALIALFLPAALLEEIGWTGFALDRLQSTYRPLPAGLILGLFWMVWHYPALIQVGRSIEWIAWWSLGTVSARVIMVWLYNWTGASVFAVALYHALSNLCWQLYPVGGSYFDPRISGLITFGLALLLTVASGSRSSLNYSSRPGEGRGRTAGVIHRPD
jgi:uncharacterized protein